MDSFSFIISNLFVNYHAKVYSTEKTIRSSNLNEILFNNRKFYNRQSIHFLTSRDIIWKLKKKVCYTAILLFRTLSNSFTCSWSQSSFKKKGYRFSNYWIESFRQKLHSSFGRKRPCFTWNKHPHVRFKMEKNKRATLLLLRTFPICNDFINEIKINENFFIIDNFIIIFKACAKWQVEILSWSYKKSCHYNAYWWWWYTVYCKCTASTL